MMKKILYAAMLLLGLSLLSSCSKSGGEEGNNVSNQLSGTWTVIAAKVPSSGTPTPVLSLADKLMYITFKSNGSVQFEDADGVLETGNYSYTEKETYGEVVAGVITFTNASLKGGDFERIKSYGQDRISWDDIDGISISIMSGRITF